MTVSKAFTGNSAGVLCDESNVVRGREGTNRASPGSSVQIKQTGYDVLISEF